MVRDITSAHHHAVALRLCKPRAASVMGTTKLYEHH
jgi:hypothetical protein